MKKNNGSPDGEPDAKKPMAGFSVSGTTGVASATVTETEILRGQVRDLKEELERTQAAVVTLDERSKQLAEVIKVLVQEQKALRGHLEAFRAGAILDEDP